MVCGREAEAWFPCQPGSLQHREEPLAAAGLFLLWISPAVPWLATWLPPVPSPCLGDLLSWSISHGGLCGSLPEAHCSCVNNALSSVYTAAPVKRSQRSGGSEQEEGGGLIQAVFQVTLVSAGSLARPWG